MTVPTMCAPPNTWLDNQIVFNIKTIASGVVAMVAEDLGSYHQFRILFKPHTESHGQPYNPESFQIGTCRSDTQLNLFQTIISQSNTDYFNFVMKVRQIFGADIENVVDAIGVPDGIIAVLEVEAQELYQLIQVSTNGAMGALQTRTVLIKNMADSEYWDNPLSQIHNFQFFLASMYQEAVARQCKSRNQWMHVQTFNFMPSTLGFYMGAMCEETIRLLAGASSDIDYRDWQGNTALHFATHPFFCDDFSSPLIAENASLTVRNMYDEMPIHEAISNNNEPSLMAILNADIDPDVCSINGDSLSSFMVKSKCDSNIEKMINVYLGKWAARKAVEEILQSALL